MAAMTSLRPCNNEHQQSINDFWSCIKDTQSALHWRKPIINVSAACMGNNASDHMATISQQRASTERQEFIVLHIGQSEGYGTALTHNQLIGCLHWQRC